MNFVADHYQCNLEENIDGKFNCFVKAEDGDGTNQFNKIVYQLQEPSYNVSLTLFC